MSRMKDHSLLTYINGEQGCHLNDVGWQSWQAGTALGWAEWCDLVSPWHGVCLIIPIDVQSQLSRGANLACFKLPSASEEASIGDLRLTICRDLLNLVSDSKGKQKLSGKGSRRSPRTKSLRSGLRERERERIDRETITISLSNYHLAARGGWAAS